MKSPAIYRAPALWCALAALACNPSTDIGGATLLCGLPPERACPPGLRCDEATNTCRDARADGAAPLADGGASADGGARVDGGVGVDGGGVAVDGGASVDGGSLADGGSIVDGGAPDAGAPDAGVNLFPLGVVAGSVYHSCAVSDGGLYCWGRPEWGMLGNGFDYTTGLPSRVPIAGHASMVAAGGAHTCAIVDGEVYCFGLSQEGAAGPGGLVWNPFRIEIDACDGGTCPTTFVTAGYTHSCAIRAGEVYCWGSNQRGQLGVARDGGFEVTRVPAISGAIAVGGGESHSCALLDGGSVRCWGNNENGELGGGALALDAGLRAVTVALAGPAKNLSVGSRHACAVLASNGTVHCWGAGDAELGTGDSSPRSTPAAVLGLGGGVATVSAGGRHSCALKTDGRLFCWGYNNSGELGIGDRAASTFPEQIQSPVDFVSVAAAATHTCALRASGQTMCWGADWNGQLGTEVRHRTTPRAASAASASAIVPLRGAVEISVGDKHSCAIVREGEDLVRCWGDNRLNQLGTSTDPEWYDGFFYDVPLERAPVELTAGEDHACVRFADGGASCWGLNAAGQLGRGDLLNRPGPELVDGLGVVDQIAAGHYHTCARVSGQAYCWGYNAQRQVGYATDVVEVTTPHPAGPLGGVTSLALGNTFSCALLGDGGTVECWGSNYNRELGTDTWPDAGVPSRVVGISNATSIVAGSGHACAIIGSGETSLVRCWGNNSSAQLGNGVTASGSPPVNVQTLRGIAGIAVGRDHTCALVADGGVVYCWGGNPHGQVGTGTPGRSTRIPTPTPVAGLGPVARISARDQHTCALLVDGGQAFCWGEDMSGQLGSGQAHYRLTPTPVAPFLP